MPDGIPPPARSPLPAGGTLRGRGGSRGMTSVVEVAKRHIERQGQMIEYVLNSRELAIELGDQEHAAGMADAAARCSEIAEYWARYIPTGAQS